MSGNGIDHGQIRTGMAESLLREIVEHLERLATTGESAAIDLRSLPMTEADRDELEERLGRGEVNVLLDVAGESELWETLYSGVWWVRHLGAGEHVAAERIEITPVPEILSAAETDIAAAAARLRQDLAGDEPPKSMEETAHG